MVFTVALYVPWCRRLEAMPAVRPQLYADNLKCTAERPGALFDAARFTSQYVRSVGQDVSPGKCVLLSTSKAVRKVMRRWDVSGDGKAWKVKLDVRDLDGHLDLTLRARAGTLSKMVKDATHGVAAVVLFPLGSRSSWVWLGVSICLLVFMLLKLRMFLFLLWPLFVHPLVGLSGPARCPWLVLLLS